MGFDSKHAHFLFFAGYKRRKSKTNKRSDLPMVNVNVNNSAYAAPANVSQNAGMGNSPFDMPPQGDIRRGRRYSSYSQIGSDSSLASERADPFPASPGEPNRDSRPDRAAPENSNGRRRHSVNPNHQHHNPGLQRNWAVNDSNLFMTFSQYLSMNRASNHSFLPVSPGPVRSVSAVDFDNLATVFRVVDRTAGENAAGQQPADKEFVIVCPGSHVEDMIHKLALGAADRPVRVFLRSPDGRELGGLDSISRVLAGARSFWVEISDDD
ncbi:hypothetical protein B0T24DRAFT_678436 [Lasiosphaeria ovina]|uniref:Uncharacterized protein n=1 Tax=Lasiosphaeria ovina TaxID=92902 RepID=A0AAE0N7H5_9PEZI|nr:hypothetical protein B0T24DRAFT_678436 [Lasiosphaeria ovina]